MDDEQKCNCYDLESRLMDLKLLYVLNSDLPFEEKKSAIEMMEKRTNLISSVKNNDVHTCKELYKNA